METITLFVLQRSGGVTILDDVRLSNTILEVMQRIEEVEHLPVNVQELRFDGILLDTKQTVGGAGLSHEEDIHLTRHDKDYLSPSWEDEDQRKPLAFRDDS